MNRHRFRPSDVDSLESLRLLSGLVPLVAPPPADLASARPRRVHLGGTFHGTIAAFPTFDAGPLYNFSGGGGAALLGEVAVSGTLGNGPALPKAPRASGTFVLDGAGGTLSITLSASTSTHDPLPTNFHYTVTGGTGIYAHLTDHGVAHLTTHLRAFAGPAVGPAADSGTIVVPSPTSIGTFTLALTSARVR